MQKFLLTVIAVLALAACGSYGKNSTTAANEVAATPASAKEVAFNADSAYAFVKRQVDFGPRVPNTPAHKECGDWLISQLERHGGEVTVQNPSLKAFDGTILNARNIFAQFNPDAEKRILLLAHWDCRPWADQDPDPAKQKLPVDGANDGASGVGVILEIARNLKKNAPGKGVDILFVDAEDWGTDGDEESWALGTRYFVENPPVDNYFPDAAILLDMVGGKGAEFCREYFSEQAAPRVAQALWGIAASRGYADMFLNRLGGAVTDDHVQLIKHGIPAVDIIEYHPEDESGFNPRWHTSIDNMEGIDPKTLQAVGETVTEFLMNE
ncbi:MAG: M28 family peptidase [Muribaculaceae bacterium]|nr:M28 family peptidase [Muribaculaceae bacterium]